MLRHGVEVLVGDDARGTSAPPTAAEVLHFATCFDRIAANIATVLTGKQ